MTHGAIAGLLLSGLIRDGTHPWADLYDPSRKNLKGAYDFLKENLNVASQYSDWVAGGADVNAIEPGRAAVLGHGPSKLAAFRDDQGTLHVRSAICPHLGCIVSWNSGEMSWDCPCHGSRFDAFGRLLNGPANEDLATADVPVEGKTGAGR